jgi:hypothetical protein
MSSHQFIINGAPKEEKTGPCVTQLEQAGIVHTLRKASRSLKDILEAESATQKRVEVHSKESSTQETNKEDSEICN